MKYPLSCLTAILIPFLLGAGGASSQVQRRISGEIQDTETLQLPGNTKPGLSLAQDQGQVDAGLALPTITLHFALSAQQQSDLDQLLRQQQSPASPLFHKFLTPEEYGQRFGVNADDLAQVTAWLQNQGFSHIQVARGRTSIAFSGTAGQAESAFHVSIHKFQQNGESHYANTSDPSLPKALDGMVVGIGGLHDFRKRPMNIHKLRPAFTSSISGSHFLAPDDFATIYNVQPLYQSGVDGTGVKIAVVGQSDVQLTDIRAFRTAAGLPQNDPTILLVGTDPGLRLSSGDEIESDLDLEWSGAIARNASIIFVTETNVENSISYAIDNNVAPIVSISYGLCEAETGTASINTQSALFQQASAQGITVVVSSGDSGAAACDTSYPATHGLAVNIPASLPNATAIGGTTFVEGSGTYWNSSNNSYNGSAISYIPETVWNDSGSGSLEAGGGGKSSYLVKPSWQTGAGVPADGFRDVPDISFAADPNHDGFLICSNGTCTNGFRNSSSTLDVIGGTSCGAPSFAGILALLVQKLGAQGNINPRIYSLAATSTGAFHDVTSGNNAVPCRTGTTNCTTGTIGYSAGVGYDLASGWGSVNAYQMVSEWSGSGSPSGSGNGPFGFVPIAPCRVVDTRNSNGPFGGPAFSPAQTREFDIPSSPCGIPASATAYALNVTVVPNGYLGFLSIWPTGQAQPISSTLNSDGRIKANAAIVAAGTNGGVNVYATNQTNVIIDISGYFLPTSASDLQFFPLTPCRIADTRLSNGSLGSPAVGGGQSRVFPVLSSNCGIPASAQAYSLNFTVLPYGPLAYLTAWPTGQSQPQTSTLNSFGGTITANAAIVGAGSGGSVTTYATNTTDLVIDINGYFAPPSTGGLSLYTLPPCRVLDSRNPPGTPPNGGTGVINVNGSGCGSPSTSQAYLLNATVVPSGPLAYLTLWADGQPLPNVSTLNADPNTVTSNMAIVPTTNGYIDAFAAGNTYLILDISGYFVP